MSITGVKPQEMPQIWPYVREHFETFAQLSKDEVTVSELVDQIIERRRQCWIAFEGENLKACALTEIVGSPVRAVQIIFCAGEDEAGWSEDMVAEIEAWATSLGATRSRIIGRKGWERRFRDLGYRETSRIIERELANADLQ